MQSKKHQPAGFIRKKKFNKLHNKKTPKNQKNPKETSQRFGSGNRFTYMFEVQQGTDGTDATTKKVLMRCSFPRDGSKSAGQVTPLPSPLPCRPTTGQGPLGIARDGWCSGSSVWDLEIGKDCSFLPLGLLWVLQPWLCCTRLND